jgi:hypothetical protein
VDLVPAEEPRRLTHSFVIETANADWSQVPLFTTSV